MEGEQLKESLGINGSPSNSCTMRPVKPEASLNDQYHGGKEGLSLVVPEKGRGSGLAVPIGEAGLPPAWD